DGFVKVLLAAPRGYCAGVERAVDAVERALERSGPPVYVRRQIVHNLHVVRDLEAKGAVFVEEETDVPEGAVVVLSAHGVAPEVYENASGRRLTVIDATCPLVTKVHLESRRFAAEDRTILLIGHAGHEEVVGTTGQAPGRTILVENTEQARTVEVPDPERLSYLVDDETEVDPEWIRGAGVIGVTSGASAPEWLVDRMLASLAELGATEVEELRLAEEDLRFSDVRF